MGRLSLGLSQAFKSQLLGDFSSLDHSLTKDICAAVIFVKVLLAQRCTSGFNYLLTKHCISKTSPSFCNMSGKLYKMMKKEHQTYPQKYLSAREHQGGQYTSNKCHLSQSKDPTPFSTSYDLIALDTTWHKLSRLKDSQ